MFQITVTHAPSSDLTTKVALAEPLTFAGFRPYTHRGLRGMSRPVFANDGTRQPKSWVTRDAAERNVHHLIARGYTARVQEV